MVDVYVVTEGSYSDYHLVAAFSLEETAQKLAQKIDGEVEVYELDPSIIYPSMPRFAVSLKRKDGTVISCNEARDMNPSTGMPYHPLSYELWCGGKSHAHDAARHTIDVLCYAENTTHACKIATEVLAEVTAHNYWRFAEETYANFIRDTDIQEQLTAEAHTLLEGGK